LQSLDAAAQTLTIYVLTETGVFRGVFDASVKREWIPVNSGLPGNLNILKAAADGTVYAGATNPLAVYKLPQERRLDQSKPGLERLFQCAFIHPLFHPGSSQQ